MKSVTGFRFNPGTVASSDAYPIGSNINNFSFLGLSNRALRAGPQFSGVEVSVTNPALWTAAIKSPEEFQQFV